MPSQHHSSYRLLFGVCVLVMISLALPGRWSRLSSPGYLLLLLTMIVCLGRPLHDESRNSPTRHLYRGLGLLTDGARVKPLATRQPSRTRAAPAAANAPAR